MSGNPEKEMQLKSRSTGQRSLRTLRQKSENQGTWHRKRGHERARVDRAIWTLSSDEHQRADGPPLAGARGHLSTPGARPQKRRNGRKEAQKAQNRALFLRLLRLFAARFLSCVEKALIAAKGGRRGPERELGERTPRRPRAHARGYKNTLVHGILAHLLFPAVTAMNRKKPISLMAYGL